MVEMVVDEAVVRRALQAIQDDPLTCVELGLLNTFYHSDELWEIGEVEYLCELPSTLVADWWPKWNREGERFSDGVRMRTFFAFVASNFSDRTPPADQWVQQALRIQAGRALMAAKLAVQQVGGEIVEAYM